MYLNGTFSSSDIHRLLHRDPPGVPPPPLLPLRRLLPPPRGLPLNHRGLGKDADGEAVVGADKGGGRAGETMGEIKIFALVLTPSQTEPW